MIIYKRNQKHKFKKSPFDRALNKSFRGLYSIFFGWFNK